MSTLDLGFDHGFLSTAFHKYGDVSGQQRDSREEAVLSRKIGP
jgi:hypothetical protein